MKMDEYELELLEAVEKAEKFERVEYFEDIPHQTILSSLIHQYVTEKVKPAL